MRDDGDFDEFGELAAIVGDLAERDYRTEADPICPLCGRWYGHPHDLRCEVGRATAWKQRHLSIG